MAIKSSFVCLLPWNVNRILTSDWNTHHFHSTTDEYNRKRVKVSKMQMKKCQGAERDEEIVSFLTTQEGEKEEQSGKWKKGGREGRTTFVSSHKVNRTFPFIKICYIWLMISAFKYNSKMCLLKHIIAYMRLSAIYYQYMVYDRLLVVWDPTALYWQQNPN